MATPKKKHLIELMIEADVKWPDGAEYAAQDKRDGKVYFFAEKPKVMAGDSYYRAPLGPVGRSTLLSSLCRNWNKIIVTLEQYSEALAANVGEPAAMASKSNQVRESEDVQAVDAVEWHNTPSIEQLTADYHAKATEADRLQAVADEALKAADEALLTLEKAGELLGLVISIDTKPKPVEQPVRLDIISWRDLQVGDVIRVFGEYWDAETEYTVEINDGGSMPVQVGGYWAKPSRDAFKFIRRP